VICADEKYCFKLRESGERPLQKIAAVIPVMLTISRTNISQTGSNLGLKPLSGTQLTAECRMGR